MHKIEYDNIINNLSKANNVPYLDYTNDPICNDSNYFCVAVHLNQKGAELFSTKLANDLKAMKFFEEKK